jgi:hypothetical protein
MSDTTGIRITAATKDQVEQVIAYLKRISDGTVALTAPREGRDGDWLAYGTVRVSDDAPPRRRRHAPVRNLRLAGEAATRLAALVAAWQTAHPGIDALGVVERLIAEAWAETDAGFQDAADSWAGGGSYLTSAAEDDPAPPY